MIIPNLLVNNCSLGAYSSACILLNGSVVTFGSNSYGEACLGDNYLGAPFIQTPTIIPNVIATQFSRFAYHSAILNSSGVVLMCGLGLNGNLGLGDTLNRYSPTLLIYSLQNSVTFVNTMYQSSLFISNGDVLTTGYLFGYDINFPKSVFDYNGDILNITSGYYSTFTFTSTKVGGFGINQYGNLLQGDQMDRYNPGLSYNSLINVQTVDKTLQGYFHVIFQLKNTSIYGIGYNSYGCLQDSNPTSSFNQPIQLYKNYQITNIKTQAYNLGFLTNNGSFFVVGYNYYSQLGTNDTIDRLTPILYMSNMSDFWIGVNSIFAITTTNQIYASGRNDYGNLCQDTGGSPISTPTQIASLAGANITNMYIGLYHTFFTLPDGSFYGCGNNYFGQLGVGTYGNLYLSPILLPLSGIKDIKLGFFHTIVLLQNNTAYTMGNNPNGELGLGDNVNRTIPTQINLTNVVQIAASGYNSIFLTTCPSGTSGPNCNDTTCFGISSLNTELVCSGSGNCIGLDQCQCKPPSVGLECESNEYFWRGSNGAASVLGNWYIMVGGLPSNPITLPNSKSIVYINQTGSYTVTFDIPLIIQKLFIGDSQSKVVLNVNSDLKILSNFTIDYSSSIISNNANLNINNGKIFGNAQITNGNLTGNVLFYSSFSMIGISMITNSYIITYSNTFISGIQNINSSTLINNGIIDVFNNGILSSTSSLLFNYGEMNINCQNTNISIIIPILNYNSINITGGNYTFGMSIMNYPGSNLIINANSIFTNILNITNGDVFLGGYLSTPTFIFNSVGTLRIDDSIIINGNFIILETSTLIIRIKGLNQDQVDFIVVSGNVTIKSLIIVESSFSPNIGDLVPFLSTKKLLTYEKNIFITGTPFKGASFLLQDQILYFKIEFSFGSSSNPGYQCSYLGNQKVLEVNQLSLQNKMIISMTVPIRGDQIGFGFDLNGNISQSILLLTNGTNTLQYNHDPDIINPPYLIGSTSISQTIFYIGPNYQTLTLIVPNNYLINQRYIYYAELNNRNVTHFYEVYNFPIQRNGSLNKNTLNCTDFLQPTRGEVYSIPATVIMLLLYVFLFILCLIFSRYQPLKTRGLSPFLTLIFLFIQLMLEIRNYFEIPSFQGSLCFYYAYGIFPLQQLCFILILLYFIRYFSIINLNENKKSIYHSLKIKIEISWVQKFKSYALKLLSSAWFIYTIIISYIIIILIIFTIILGSYTFYCQYDTLITLKSIQSSFLLIIYILISLTLLIDIISNYSLIIKCKLIQYSIYSDPYYFRLQIILFFPFVIFSAISDIFFLATSTNYPSVVSHFKATITLNTIIYSFILVIDILLPLFITIYELIKFKIQKQKQKAEGFETIIEDKEIEIIFIEFCQSEFSLENVLCYKDIMEYKKSKTNPIDLYLKYFNGNNSIMEVNVANTKRGLIFDRIKNNDIDETLFDSILTELTSNLADTYSRFVFYPKYNYLIKKRENQKKLIETKI